MQCHLEKKKRSTFECLSQRKENYLIGHKQSPWHLKCIPTRVKKKKSPVYESQNHVREAECQISVFDKHLR